MLKKLTNRVYYMDHVQETDRPALGLICGDSYSLIVDAGNSPAHAKEFLQKASELDIQPIKYVTITHWHWDHTFGMDAMGGLAISHRGTKKKLGYMKELKWDDASLDSRVEKGEETPFCRDMIKAEMPTRHGLKLMTPDIIFDDKIEIDLGGITCVVQHVGGGHAEDSSIIYVPEEKVLFLGDCLCEDYHSGPPSYDHNEFKKLIDKIKHYDADHYVTSHHVPETHEEFWGYFQDLAEIGDIVREELSFEKALEKLRVIRQSEPDEDQKGSILSFVNGNEKRANKKAVTGETAASLQE
ncbi:MBL fold metallo-hydrolase [Heyndrickxia acidicola]|uniref:MBL fold metallo-hydrolase n=1 Tax=Heyndrickxia acidicola TaxID=209389 RepID=A0ABU6MMA0_9BACI|nr:MBL fold metallo-hydrolase [Heyndrickxia acidicola]MED1205812.1 MBL fold metallo-hydrolase [Heyndrickxia acidicola]